MISKNDLAGSDVYEGKVWSDKLEQRSDASVRKREMKMTRMSNPVILEKSL